LDLAGAIVTIDAIGTQTTIAKTILPWGGDYLVALKANRPEAHGHGPDPSRPRQKQPRLRKKKAALGPDYLQFLIWNRPK
jgi:hypothetical protein